MGTEKSHRKFTAIETFEIDDYLLSWPDEKLAKHVADTMKKIALKNFLCCTVDQAQRDVVGGSKMVVQITLQTKLRNGDDDNGHD